MSLVKVENFEESLNEIRMHLEDYLKEQGLDITNGRKIKCINPEHDDKHPSMSVFTTKEGNPAVKCFSCNFAADIFTAAHVLEHKPLLGPGFVEDNVLYLAKKYDVEVKTKALTEEEIYEVNTYQAYKIVANYISSQKFGELQLAELERRGWKEDFVKSKLVGCCPDYSAMRDYLKSLGFSAKFLDEIDIGNPKLFSEENLIFTVSDDHGRPVGFAARNLKFDGVKDDNGRLLNGPKFNNTRTTGLKCNIYRKSERLYLMHDAKVNPPPLYIFEGYGDAMTAQQAGMKNATAIGSLELSEHHLNACRKNGCYDVIVCLDCDERGMQKARVLLDEVLKSIHDIKIRFIFLPDKEVEDEDGNKKMVKVDPDIFIRENGIKEFLKLPKIDPFTWRLQQFEEDEDASQEAICLAMVPIISSEPSPVKREGMIKELSEFTGYSDKAIREELEKIKNADEARILRNKEAVVDNLVHSLKERKDSPAVLIQRAQDDLYSIDKENKGNSLDTNSRVNNILAIKEYEETEELHQTMYMGDNLHTLEVALSGDLRQKMLLLGGTANTGKTTLFANLSFNLAKLNTDVLPIVLTIDDSAKEFTPRLVTYDMAKRNYQTNPDLFDLITINKVATPFLFKERLEYDAIMEEREISFRNVISLVRDEKLVVLDSEDGRSVDFINTVLKHYSERHPDKRVIMFIDNFHLVEVPGAEDGRTKYKKLSHALKQMCVTYNCTVVSTAEYTKIPKGQKPSNNNLAETVALEYDSNAIIHLYSNLHDMREESTKYFPAADGQKYPIIDMDFGKNKINSFKGTSYYRFFPDKAFYMEVSEEQVNQMISANEQIRMEQRQIEKEEAEGSTGHFGS